MKVHGRFSGIGLVLAAALLAGCASTPPPVPVTGEPANLSRAKAAVVAYYASGDYDRDVSAIAVRAEAWLKERGARRAAGEKLAVVFDIDETVLTSFAQMKRQDFGYTEAPWAAWLASGEAPVIAPVREVYRAARESGIAVFFVTGRGEPADRSATELNLRRVGLGDYERLILKPAAAKALKASQWKASVRRGLVESEGWTIIASVGDQESDLAGGFAERGFKLPNPCYEIP